jgi:rhodanese-related sulfurtransferase
MASKEPKKITCEHLQRLREDEAEHIVVDIRDNADFDTGHITGSLHVPQRELADNIGNLLSDKEKKVVVVVGPTQEAEVEAVHETLAGLGYKNVEFLAGGFDRWCEIAPLEIEPDLAEGTPEERGFVGDELSHIDPEEGDNEPLF